MTNQPTDLLSTVEVAARFGVAYQTVARWCRTGVIPGVIDRGPKRKARYLIPAESLEDFEPPSASGGGWPAGRKRK